MYRWVEKGNQLTYPTIVNRVRNQEHEGQSHIKREIMHTLEHINANLLTVLITKCN